MFGPDDNQFVSFCIDLDDYISTSYNPVTWNVVSLASSPNPNPPNTPGNSMGDIKAGQLARLLGGVLGTSLNDARLTNNYNLDSSGLTLSESQRAAALQVAVWEIVWESGSTYKVGKGTVEAFGNLQFNLDTNSLIAQQANWWLGRLNNYTAMGGLVGLTSPLALGALERQDFIGQVPIPAAAWLFGSAILGTVALGRRKQKEGAEA